MKELNELHKAKDEDEFLDKLLGLATICLKSVAKDVSEKSDLDEVLDLDTTYKIIEICGGAKLNDPKLAEAAMTAAMKDQVGTN